MALYMLMAKYTTASLKGILETGTDREAAARQAVEAAGGKLLGFYGMLYRMGYNIDIEDSTERLSSLI